MISKLESELEIFKDKQEKLEADLTKAQAEAKQASDDNKELAALNKELGSNMKEQGKSKGLNSKLKIKIEALEKELKDDKKQFNSFDLRISDYERNLKDKDEQINKLEAEKGKMKTEFANNKSSSESASELRTKIDDLEKRLSQKEENAIALSDEIEAVKKERNFASLELVQVRKELKQIQLQKVNKKTSKNDAQLSSRYEAIKKESDGLKEELTFAKNNIDKLNDNNKLLSQKNVNLREEVNSLLQSTSEVKGFDEKLIILEKEVVSKEAQQKELRKQIDLADSQRQSIALELASVQKKYAALQSEAGKQPDVSDDNSEQFKLVQNQKQILQQKLKQAIEEVKIRSEKGLFLLKKVKALDADLAKSEEEKVVMALEVVKLREEKVRLEKKIMESE